MEYWAKVDMVQAGIKLKWVVFAMRIFSNECLLKMLGLYQYTLIIGYKSCNMLIILNKLTLQKELQNFMTNNVFVDKK